MARKKIPPPEYVAPITVRSVIEELPEAEVRQALLSSGDSIAYQFLKSWENPKNKNKDLSLIARDCEFSISHFCKIWEHYNLQRGMMLMVGKVPKVMLDVAEDAQSKMENCPRCDGMGEIQHEKIEMRPDGEVKVSLTRVCPQCKGAKEIRVSGSRDARALMFETMKLTGQRGPLVAIQQNFGERLGQTVGTIEKMIGWGEKQ